MASPWKFLSRLMPRRREPKQDDAEVADGKPDPGSFRPDGDRSRTELGGLKRTCRC
jgi:hypothetical protein